MIVGSSAAWAQSDYSQTYTTGSDITWAHGVKVSINGTDYDANKLGTTSSAGSTKFTVPSGTKYLHLHIAGWNNETVKLSVNAGSTTITSLAITSDAGISGGGSTFTISDDADLSKFYHVVTFTNALSSNTEIEIKATSGKRFVIWGIIAEEENATPLASNDLALTDAPVALRFDLYNNKASQTVSFTTSSTGEVTVSESEFVTTSISGNTITVTPIKVTPSPQTISVSQAADDTYATGSVTFTVSIDDSTPFDGGDVTFDATKDKGTSPLTKEVVTFTCSNGVLNNGSEYRLYKNSTTTFSVSEGTITKIVFTGTSGNPASGFGNQTGWTTSGNNGTWVGSAKEVSFTASGAQVRATQIVVTVESATANPAVVTTVTIDDANLTNTNVFDGTAAGKLTASVKAADGGPIDGATVTWTSSEEAVATIATDGTVTLVAAGTTTITANYAGVENQYRPSSATYELTVTYIDPNAPGTENKPYTVAQARAAIDAGTGVTGVYATGTVSEIVTAYNSQFGNITYNISTDGTTTADQLQAYRGKSYNGDKFTSEEDIQVGDVVVVYGNLTKYGSTYEFAQDNQLVSLNRPVVTTPTLTVTPANVTVPYTGGSGDFTVTANNVNNAFGSQIRFFDPADPETAINEQPTWIDFSYDYSNLSFSYSITEENQTGADRTACFKFYIMCDNGGALSNLITVTQQTYVAPTVATLPFEFNNGKADIEDTDGLTQEGVGSDYSASPKLKFDTTGDWLLLHFDERPGILTFDIKNNSFSGGTFTVQTSEDGVTYTDLEAYTTITGTQNEEFDNLDENVRYIKWIYTEKVSGNVGLGNIKLAKYAAPAPSITIAATDAQVNVAAAGGDGNISFTYENLNVTDNNDFDVVFFDADDNEINQPGWIQAEVNAIDNIYYVVDANTDAADRTAYLKVYAIDDENNDVYSNVVTITQEGVPPVVTKEYFVKVTNTSDLTDGQYLIVNEENGIAFDGSLTTLDAVRNNKEVVVSENIALAETSLIFTYDANAKTLKSASGYYIGQTSDANGLASNNTTTYENTISFDDEGNANIVSGSAYLRYNAASNADRFRYYKSSSYTNQKPVQLYKLTTTTPTVAVTITDAGYATYCSAYNLDFSNVSDLTAYEATINGTTVAFNEGDKKFAAGEGILLKGDKGTYNIPVVATATVNTDNKLVGVLADTEVAAGIYVLLNTNNNPGFYKTKSAFTVGAHTAYLPAQAGGNGAREFIAIDDNTTTGVNSIDNGHRTMDNVYNLNGQRVNNAKKGLYIVNGKKVVIK